MQLPLGLFGVAVASASLPQIPRDASEGRINGFRDTLSKSLGLVFLFTIPSAVGLFVLSHATATKYAAAQLGLIRVLAGWLAQAGYPSVKHRHSRFESLAEAR